MSVDAIRSTYDPSDATPRRRAEPRHFFTVRAAGKMFGLPVDSVQTIFRLQSITPVPLGPAVISGLVNLRGKIVTAVSLEKRLGLHASEPATLSPLAVAIDCRGESFALVVDAVGDAMTCSEEDRIPSPRHVADERARLTGAYYRTEAGILPVLDMNALFDIRPQRRTRPEHSATSDTGHSGAEK